MRRTGFSLLELLIAVAIIGLMIALLLPAVQAVREAALRSHSQNQMRQIMLAAHNFASANSGRLPSIDGNPRSANLGISFFGALYEFVERSDRIFMSPADPTATLELIRGIASYAANGEAFRGDPHLTRSVPDGTANTIGLAEHYSTQCGTQRGTQGAMHSFLWAFPSISLPIRRATFADREMGDFLPDSPNWASRTGKEWENWTFQVTPKQSECMPFIAQTPHRGGMLVAMIDGSSRIVAPTIGFNVYWAAVSPNGGEANADW